ncbi:outer membrane beta-barrel protein [Ramlibacter monticola]|uniref:OmpW family protein n=1 Tax=Ramlibacter monticola TaxID=1926872 RepID=A0A936Z4C7_9BURK|nr:OmpW family outer membrane protein [Ramlibacter monticola]MBL0393352.1 OmpW family protein [Ramlibacter monticola]
MHNNEILCRLLAAATLALGAAGAHAQGAAGSWFGGIGVTHIAPDVSSGNLSPPSAPGTQIDVDSDTQPTIFIGRMITDNWSVEVPIGLGFKQKIQGAGAIAGVGQIATVRTLPITVFAQYRFFEPTQRIRPYVMLGLTYTYNHDEQGSATLNAVNPINPPGGTQIDVENRFSLTPGLGVTAMINERWFVDAQYAKSFLKTKTTLNTGQTIEAKIDPNVFRLAVGMRF